MHISADSFDANDGKWMYKMHRFEVGLRRLLFLFEAKGFFPAPVFVSLLNHQMNG